MNYYTLLDENGKALWDSFKNEFNAREAFAAHEEAQTLVVHTRPLKQGKKSWQCKEVLLDRRAS